MAVEYRNLGLCLSLISKNPVIHNNVLLGLKEEGRGPRFPERVGKEKKSTNIYGMFTMCQILN